jgi:hypothetical protein
MEENDAETIKRLEEKKWQLTAQIQAAQQVYQSNIAAIDTAILVIKGKTEAAIPPGEDAGLTQMVLFALQHVPQEFSIRDIQKTLSFHYPSKVYDKPSLGPIFWKIMHNKKWPVVKPAAGNQPAIYRKLL